MDVENKKTVMFLNSDMTVSSYLKSFLEDNHYDVFGASTADDVLLTLTIKPVSCILLDIFIKWGNSMELLRMIRKQFIDIPIIVMGDGNIKNIVNFQKFSISDYIIKPINKLKLLERIEKSIEERGDTYLRYYHIGELYFASKHFDIARISFENAIKLNEDFIPAYVSLVEIYFELDQIDAAKEYLDTAFEKSPEDVRLLELKGDMFCKRKQYPKALSAYRRVVKSDPARVGVFVKLAKTHVLSGELKSALLSLLNVIKIKPDYREAIYEALDILAQEKNYEQMYAVSKKSLRYYPNDERVISYYFMALYQSGLMQELGEFFAAENRMPFAKPLFSVLQSNSFARLSSLASFLPKKVFVTLLKYVVERLTPDEVVPLLDVFFPLITKEDFFAIADENVFRVLMTTAARQRVALDTFLKKHSAQLPPNFLVRIQTKVEL